MRLVRAAVAQRIDQAVPFEHRERRLATELVERRLEALAAFGDRIEHRQRGRLAHLLQVRFAQLGESSLVRIGCGSSSICA